MPDSELSIVTGAAVRRILDGREDLVLKAVTEAYLAHARGQTNSPGTKPLYAHGGRFFAMPASIDDAHPIVGMKWVASFAGNVSNGAERASAMLIVNDSATGRPYAIVDGTLISAKRTAAAATVALRLVQPPGSTISVGLAGCGPINYEILRFIAHLYPISRLYLADLDPQRADSFAQRVQAEFPAVPPVASSLDELLQAADVVSFGTNATTPHVHSIPKRQQVILHISLRDLAPSIIANCYNIVDDVEHVCSAKTSVHLASEEFGRRDFIRATIPDLLAGTATYERPPVPTIVSPFGMAILDLAVLREVLARMNGDAGLTRITDFRGLVWQ